MFERFTERARTSLTLAQAEAGGLSHRHLGAEHLLLGLLAEGGGVAARVLLAEGMTLEGLRAAVGDLVGRRHTGIGDAEALASIGIDLVGVRAAVEGSFGEGALERSRRKRKGGRLSAPAFNTEAKQVLEWSLREALTLGHNYIGTEHLLLAACRLGEGVAFEVLEELARPRTGLRTKVLAEMTKGRPTP